MMYQSLEAELHDAFWDSEGPAAELPLLRDFLKNHPGKSLEIGCGSGRLLYPLLRDGFQMEGLDNAPAMITLAKDAAAKEGLMPTLHEGELADHKPSFRYHALALPAFTLQLFENPAEALKDCHRLLSNGGGLYLTVFYPLAEDYGDLPEGERYHDHEITLPDGCRATIETEHHIDRDGLVLTRHHYYEVSRNHGESEHYQSTQELRYCLEDEWRQLLAESGFELLKTIHDFESEDAPEDEGAGICTFFCRKKLLPVRFGESKKEEVF